MDANELLDSCVQLIAEPPSETAYHQLHQLLVLACHGLRHEGTAFGNLFSQIDWLCRQHHVSAVDRYAIQTARRHAARPQPPSSNDSSTLQGNQVGGTSDSAPCTAASAQWRSDVSATARFIAAIYHVPLPSPFTPSSSSSHLSSPTFHATPPTSVRCIVSSFDDNFITADSDDGPLTIDYGNTEKGRDLTYLRKILRKGMQLNLLDCRLAASYPPSSYAATSAQSLLPTLIVVEPDFLVDISALATCFTGYGHHPLLYTLNRLQETPPTQAILLGNFAGAALDELIHDPTTPTDTILQRSYREQALRFLACPDFDADKFSAEAERQVSNIREAVAALTSRDSSFTPSPSRPASTPSHFLLEPSFVSEQLGLQGRVDLMTDDLHLLVEQKAGRNMKIERLSHDAHGLQREDHYVQLLLYYGVLRYNFGLNNTYVDTRLLYSRYPPQQGLLIVNYYRTLFLEAIRLRNQIVATELLIARDGFARIMPLLNADIIYKDVKRDAYFHRFIQPRLSHLSAQLTAITPLERAYFERMMTFVYREQACQKLGTLDEQSHATADLWQMPLHQKHERGDIVANLTITDRQRSQTLGGYDLITLNSQSSARPKDACYQRDARTPKSQFSIPNSHPSLNFRRGDLVCLYRYDQTTPDICHSILYKGVLQDITTDSLVVRLNDGQQNADIFPLDNVARWAVEHTPSDISTSSNIRSLFRFITADPHRRNLLLGQRPPVADTSLTLTRSYHPHYDDIVLRQKQARDYFLLIGPPGTGKTSMALRFMVLEELSSSTSNILLTAYTNRAVDEICAMLADADLPFLRIGNPASCDPRFRDHLIDAALSSTPASSHDPSPLNAFRRESSPHRGDRGGCPSTFRRNSSPLRGDQGGCIVSTTSMLQARPEVLSLMHFSLCIVDEASQILEPSIIGILSSAAIDRFVLVGDHKQLPAVVAQPPQLSVVDEPLLRAIALTDCRQSLFERLLRWEQSQGRTQFVGTLTHQGRMHPDVARFPAHAFYRKEQLTAVGLSHQLEGALNYDLPAADALDRLLQSRRVIFLPTDTPSISPHSAPPTPNPTFSTQNVTEARLVADLLRRIHRFYANNFSAEKTVGVIVPYRNQIALIRQELEALGIPDLLNVSIDTVERYQGSQRDVIIYSFTVSHRYQLDFLTANTFDDDGLTIDRKLNVALTRARRQMIMVGNASLLSSVPLFRQLIDDYTPSPLPS